MNLPRYVRDSAGPLRRGEARPAVLILGALLTLAIFVVDLSLPLGIAGGTPYIAPVLLAVWLPDRRLIVAVAAACSLLVAAGLWMSPPGAAWSIALTNRVLAVGAIWTVAVLSVRWKAFEGALVRSEATNRAVLATTADGILTLDAHGRVASANPAAERIFGLTAAALRGRAFAELLDAGDGERFSREPSAFLGPEAPGAPRTHEMTGRHASGAGFPLEVAFAPVAHDGGLQHTVTVRDITERRLLEQHLLRASDEERRAVGHRLHEELGQSLTGLGLISRQLARRLEGRQLAEASEAAELVGLLREVDRQVQDLVAAVAPLDAQHELGEALGELAEVVARRHGVPISVSCEGLEAPADGSKAAQLYQLARDLLNAALSGPSVGSARVEGGGDGGGCWLRLRLRWPGGRPAGWADRLRPLAYRANLIGVRVELADGERGEGTVTCRWSAAHPNGAVPGLRDGAPRTQAATASSRSPRPPSGSARR